MRHLSIHAAKLSLSVVLLAGFGLSGFVKQIATTVAAAPPARPRVARTGPVTATASQCVEVIQNAARSLACF